MEKYRTVHVERTNRSALFFRNQVSGPRENPFLPQFRPFGSRIRPEFLWKFRRQRLVSSLLCTFLATSEHCQQSFSLLLRRRSKVMTENVFPCHFLYIYQKVCSRNMIYSKISYVVVLNTICFSRNTPTHTHITHDEPTHAHRGA